jgi:K(+)-stimulated pyrophosphate-energized sodium pump
MQAVSTGAYHAVKFIKANIRLEGAEKASTEDSKKVVEICTKFAQKGMINLFLAIFFGTLAFACLDPYFFIGYLISIALFGLYQAIFMANAGGAWDNAKKYVEVDLKEKGTELHAATVVGDTVGDPFKDTSSVAMNPIIKFSTGTQQKVRCSIGGCFLCRQCVLCASFILRYEDSGKRLGLSETDILQLAAW